MSANCHECSHPDITSEEPKTRTADRSSGNQAAPTSHVTPSHSSTRAMAARLSLCGPIRVQQSTRHSARVRASERENERRLRQIASDAFKRIGSARDEVHAGQRALGPLESFDIAPLSRTGGNARNIGPNVI